MKLHPRSFAMTAAVVLLPVLARAQHSHGGGMDMPRTHEPHERASPPPAPPRGVLPPGSPRQIEVLVLSYGFSPGSISAQAGEEVVLLVRRADASRCADGLAIPAKQILVKLPLDETVPVTLKLELPETIEIHCANEDLRSSIIVAPR